MNRYSKSTIILFSCQHYDEQHFKHSQMYTTYFSVMNLDVFTVMSTVTKSYSRYEKTTRTPRVHIVNDNNNIITVSCFLYVQSGDV